MEREREREREKNCKCTRAVKRGGGKEETSWEETRGSEERGGGRNQLISKKERKEVRSFPEIETGKRATT